MRARIYLPPKSAMQSGRAGSEWVLHYDSAAPERADRLMGWIGGGDTQAQVRLSFRTKEEAFVKANRSKIPALGKAAEAALDGPEGAELRAAEAEAANHAAGEE